MNSGAAMQGLERGLLLAALAAVGAAVVLALVWWGGSLYDDAYIYLTYADHLVEGCGLRFRCDGEVVEGFTGPLWLALLTLGRTVTTRLEIVATVLGAVSLVGALAVSVDTARRIAGPGLAGGLAALGTALALGLDPYVLLNAVTGLEAPLGMLVVALALRQALTRERRWLRTLLVASVLVRPECAILLALVPVLPDGRRLAWLLPLGAAVAAIVLGRWLAFHDVLPNTYWAKAGGTPRHVELGWTYVKDALTDFPLVALAPLALVPRATRTVASWLLLASAAWLASFLRTGGDTFHYGRLFVPLVPALTVLGVATLPQALPRLKRWGAPVAATLALLGGARAAVVHHLDEAHGFPNVERWATVGRFLHDRHPGARIATVPVGAISYFSGASVLDLVGLTSREIAHAGRTVPPELLTSDWIGHERHDTEAVLAEAPDLLVFTKYRGRPFRSLAEARAGFYAELLLLRAVKAGEAPYALYSPEVAPGLWWLMLRRTAPRGP